MRNLPLRLGEKIEIAVRFIWSFFVFQTSVSWGTTTRDAAFFLNVVFSYQ